MKTLNVPNVKLHILAQASTQTKMHANMFNEYLNIFMKKTLLETYLRIKINLMSVKYRPEA